MTMSEIFLIEDIEILNDREFILRKNALLKKLINQLAEKAELLQNKHGDSFALSPPPKVNRGEHYRGFPYLVMDYPRIFSTDNVFAFRTLFWWGHFFSCTLHLKGEFLKDFQENLSDLLSQLRNDKSYPARISIAGNEWNHDAKSDEYNELVDLENPISTAIQNRSFFKLSMLLEIEEIDKFDDFFSYAEATILNAFE